MAPQSQHKRWLCLEVGSPLLHRPQGGAQLAGNACSRDDRWYPGKERGGLARDGWQIHCRVLELGLLSWGCSISVRYERSIEARARPLALTGHRMPSA